MQSLNCGFINKDFIDFTIPEDLKEKGDEAVEEYRNWFKLMAFAEQFYSNTLDISKMVFAYNSKFPKKYNVKPLNEGYKLVEQKPNSNHLENEDEFNYDAFLIKIEDLLYQYNYEFQSKVLRILSKFDYLLKKSDLEINEKVSELFSVEFIKNYGMKNLKDKLVLSRNIKKELMQSLINYFKWTYNLSEKDFANLTLDNFGLECCGNCKKEIINKDDSTISPL